MRTDVFSIDHRKERTFWILWFHILSASNPLLGGKTRRILRTPDKKFLRPQPTTPQGGLLQEREGPKKDEGQLPNWI